MAAPNNTLTAPWLTNVLLGVVSFFMVQALLNQKDNAKDISVLKSDVSQMKSLLERSLEDQEKLEEKLEKLRDKKEVATSATRPPFWAKLSRPIEIEEVYQCATS